VAISRRAGLALSLVVWIAGVPLAHGVVPWLLSRVGPRFESSLNALGLIPIAFGAALLAWVMRHHVARAREGPERVEIDWKPKHLLAAGPYRWSRNPMYVGEIALWLGWALWFGSPVVLAGAVLLALAMQRAIVREERALLDAFGDEYRAYRETVPRWLPLWTKGQ
jgi:protein-S-isoprenylcysteine O-methyltransferase Ste14